MFNANACADMGFQLAFDDPLPTTPSAFYKQRLALHPSHVLILAANCANLPSLPYSKPAPLSFPGSVVTLPVIPLCIPSPDTFPILLDYLYMWRGSCLLGSLLLLTPRAEIQSLVQLVRELAEMASLIYPAKGQTEDTMYVNAHAIRVSH